MFPKTILRTMWLDPLDFPWLQTVLSTADLLGKWQEQIHSCHLKPRTETQQLSKSGAGMKKRSC